MPEKVGLIAGWGKFPITVAKRLTESGCKVYCLGLHGLADDSLKDICHHYRSVGVTRLGTQIRYFRRHGVVDATMAGKVHKTLLFQRFAWLRHLPDLTFWRYFHPHFLTGKADRNDDTLLGTTIDMFNDYGIRFAPAVDFAPELLVSKGLLTESRITEYQQNDIRYAWQLAKKMGDLDVGQCVVVKGRAVLSVEAVEGTDECIRRSGQLCPAGGFTVVKVAKPNQDMRFDVPTVGIGTLKTIKDAGGCVLAIEAGKTIILDQEEMITFANRHRIAIVAIDQAMIDADFNNLSAA